MDLELLQFRAQTLQKIRQFFIEKKYLELDTPAMSPTLIPETCLEVFSADYIEPWTNTRKPVFLVPSPEIYMKKIISQHKVSVFQLSKCYRNVESVGRTHSPEFTMLEYYTINFSYKESMNLTEELFEYLLPPVKDGEIDNFAELRPPFIKLSMNEAFEKYAGFKLSECTNPKELAKQAKRLGIEEIPENPFEKWPWDDLYELILVQCVEPSLPKEKPVFLYNYPAKVPCLAQDCEELGKDKKPLWKERWELYGKGIELANCYSEETNHQNIKEYFENEGNLKNQTAQIPHKINNEYWKFFSDIEGNSGFPKCSGTAMGVDRLIMLLCQKNSIDAVLPFPLK